MSEEEWKAKIALLSQEQMQLVSNYIDILKKEHNKKESKKNSKRKSE